MSGPIPRALFALLFSFFPPFSLVVHASETCRLTPVLPATGIAQGHQFGQSVHWLGDQLAVGAPFHFHGGYTVGCVSICEYDQVAGTWVESQRLIPSPQNFAAGSRFGWSLAATGNQLIVGAPRHEGAYNFEFGHVFVYRKDQSGSWVYSQEFSSTAVGAEFGWSVSAHESVLVVGARREENVSWSNDAVGAVYVYRRPPSNPSGGWTLDQHLISPSLQTGSGFGWSVAVFGDRIAVGAPEEDHSGLSDAGAVYVFEKSGSTWSLVERLTSPNPGVNGSYFGEAIGMYRDHLVVGERRGINGIPASGRAYAFERDGAGNWQFDSELIPTTQAADAWFGQAIAIENDLVAVGAPKWNHPNESGAGLVHVFRRTGGTWIEATTLRGEVSGIGDEGFGTSVDIQSGKIAVGEPMDRSQGFPVGAAHVLPDGHATVGTELCSCDSGPCSNVFSIGGCVNSTGGGAWLHGCGSTSVALDDLVLTAEDVPPYQFGILYMGPALGSAPFGDGIRCVFSGNGAPIQRYPIRSSGAEGVLSEGPGVVAFTHAAFPPAGRVQAGQTWYFQAWFRDPLGPCGATFNLSNALEVTFEP